ncbi:MAG TPA: hypothetical protein VN625_03055 [Desulfuromonadaceae bacterium]|nr:hypothetical protein [Desulfuromonadaceae bacterium]
MNDSELTALLKKARVPEPSGELWDELPGRVARQLNRARTETSHSVRGGFSRWAWGMATALCVVMAFIAGHWHGQMAEKKDALASGKVVRETLAMFPNRVRAIVEDEHGLNLVLSENEDVPASSPLYLRVCDGKQCASVVTFSGQEIQVAGRKMTVLADGHDGVILMGNNFAWSSREPAMAKNNLKIEAKNLDIGAM